MSRAYSYDQTGRVTNVDTLPNYSVLPPFSGHYSYDSFDNMTSRSGKFALGNFQSDTASYTNNRRNNWSYNAEGQITLSSDNSDNGGSSTRTWTYDAAGALVTSSEIRNGLTTTSSSSYGGDGELLAESMNGSVIDYLIRSTVLGSVLTKLTSSGGKDITYVPANGLVAPMQNQNPNSSPFLSVVYRDPLGIQEQQSNSQYRFFAYDPMGNIIPNTQPPLVGQPPYVPFYGATYGGASWSSFSLANNLATGCDYRGASTDCNSAMIQTMGLGFAANLPGAHLDMALAEQRYAAEVAVIFAGAALRKQQKTPPKLKPGRRITPQQRKQNEQQRQQDLNRIGNSEVDSDRLPGTNMTACLVMADIAEDVAQAASFREPDAALEFFDQEFSRLYHGGPIRGIADAQKWQNGTGRAPEMSFYASNGSGFQDRYRDTGTEGGLIGGRNAEQTHHFSFNLSAGINGRADVYEAGQWGIRPRLAIPLPDNAGDVRLGEAAFNKGLYLRAHPNQLINIGKWIRRNICTTEGHGLYYSASNPN